jgi:hypothetical protein
MSETTNSKYINLKMMKNGEHSILNVRQIFFYVGVGGESVVVLTRFLL